MGDELRRLDRKDEVLWRLLFPLQKALRPLQRIEGAVDLNRGKNARAVLELFLLRQLLGIEDPAPWRIRPARDADANPALAHRVFPSERKSPRTWRLPGPLCQAPGSPLPDDNPFRC